MIYWVLKVWVALSKGPQTAGRELLETKWPPKLEHPAGLQVNITLGIIYDATLLSTVSSQIIGPLGKVVKNVHMFKKSSQWFKMENVRKLTIS